MSQSFVHLHNHTEYSMLDGAAKVAPMLAEAQRLQMPAIGMTDHGNMFGASEFYNGATAAGIKPIIGIEAYVAPASRFETKRILWGDPGQKSDDVSGSGSYTHMTMVAENATGLRNLFKLSSLASFEGQVGADGRRADRRACRRHHRHHRLPVGGGADPAAAGTTPRSAGVRRQVAGDLRSRELLFGADGPRAVHRKPGARRAAGDRSCAEHFAAGHPRRPLRHR